MSHWSPVRLTQSAAKFFRLSQLRRMRGSEQVAAVCFRIRSNEIEFLLVQTRGGRWTFPKGSAEPGLTHAQAAALEAFEEAGVHGRMEEVSFARYIRYKRGARSAERSAEKELAVNAHLCEVLRLGAPQESGRNPSWFSVAKTKRRLREARTPEYAAELARVVDTAVTRIQRITRLALDGRQFGPQLDRPKKDALQKVHFTIDHASGPVEPTRAAASGRKNRRNIIRIDQF
ncbi:MAG: NUDIX domain-containing protein [Terriglobales bacterium]